MDKMLDIRGLTKAFGRFTVVDDVSFSVGAGEVLGFLGPNGAGKSTTMKMVTGFLPPSSGTAVVCGSDVVRDPIGVKKNVGYLPEGAPLYEDMTPAGLLSFAARARGLPAAGRRRAVDEAVDRLELAEVYNQRVGTLSKGFKRRVGLAQAILHDPEVLILDEPTDGLDPNQKHQVRELIGRMSPEKAIVISTHILEEVDAVCTRAIVISEGRMLADSTPGELERRSAYCNAVSAWLAPDRAEALKAALAAIPAVARVEAAAGRPDGVRLVAVPRDGQEIFDAVAAAARENGVASGQLRVERGRLEDVFREITTGASAR